MTNLIQRISCDSAYNWQLDFQDEATPIMIGIKDLYDNIVYYLIIIISLVTYLIIILLSKRTIKTKEGKEITKEINFRFKYFNHSTLLEFFWTIIPAIILIVIAIPSFKLLYAMDEIFKPLLTLKIKGNQWFWSYSISDIEGLDINFDSYTLAESDLKPGQLRLLDVDQRVYLPILTPIRLLITAEDVIHSWAVPSFGVKVDAIPGRINYGTVYILREGTYYGMCSELCGQAHHNMSIVVEAVSLSKFITWLISFSDISISNLTNVVKSVKEYIY